MTIWVVGHIDEGIFSKLEVHSRLYLKKFQKSSSRESLEQQGYQLVNSLTTMKCCLEYSSEDQSGNKQVEEGAAAKTRCRAPRCQL